MNERIDKLAEQAGVNFDATVVRMGPYAYFDYKKFAELIVKECISRIEGCAVTTEDDEFVKGYNKGVSKVSSQVKHHFGVRE